jgi:predicted anti-sigma-YlaC factor YlaD
MTHEHTHCKELLGSLSDYVDGSLGEQLCAEIKSHVAECENCRIVVDTLRRTVTLYHESAAEMVNLPADVRERLFRRLELNDTHGK